LMMGLEEHLITMFRGDVEFHENAAPSHLGTLTTRGDRWHEEASTPAAPASAIRQVEKAVQGVATKLPAASAITWAPEAELELRKIPFFVRGKARRNTERYAHDRAVPTITVETLYDAKAHFSR